MDYYAIVKEMVDGDTVIERTGLIHYKGKKYSVTIDLKEIKTKGERKK